MRRFVNVIWEDKVVLPETHASKIDADRASFEWARKNNRSAYEVDAVEVEVEAF